MNINTDKVYIVNLLNGSFSIYNLDNNFEVLYEMLNGGILNNEHNLILDITKNETKGQLEIINIKSVLFKKSNNDIGYEVYLTPFKLSNNYHLNNIRFLISKINQKNNRQLGLYTHVSAECENNLSKFKLIIETFIKFPVSSNYDLINLINNILDLMLFAKIMNINNICKNKFISYKTFAKIKNYFEINYNNQIKYINENKELPPNTNFLFKNINSNILQLKINIKFKKMVHYKPQDDDTYGDVYTINFSKIDDDYLKVLFKESVYAYEAYSNNEVFKGVNKRLMTDEFSISCNKFKSYAPIYSSRDESDSDNNLNLFCSFYVSRNYNSNKHIISILTNECK
jgi:hypothetical protein